MPGSRLRPSAERRRAGRRGAPANRVPRARGSAPEASHRRSRRRWPTASLVAPVPLLQPRIAAQVVAVRLPEAGLVLVPERQSAHPLGALPEVEVRDEETGRAAVLGVEGLAVVAEGDPGLAARDVLQ